MDTETQNAAAAANAQQQQQQQQQQAGGQPAAAANSGGQASLYVGDLHPEVTEATLFEKFSAIGPLTTIRVCRDNVTRRSLGYAYVNYVSHDDAKRALEELNYEEIRGRPCRIMWSQRDPSIRRSNAGNIFIKNLHKDIDNKALLDTFSQFGNILSCKVKTDQNNVSLGYGFVHYATPEAAAEAISKVNGKMVMGQKVFVGPFKTKDERLADMGKNAARFTNVFIKNLPGDFTEDRLEDLFGQYGKITSRKVMRRVHEGVEKCIAFAAFEESEAAQAAVKEMHEKDFEGQKLYVARAQSKAERQALLRRDYERRRADMQHQSKGVNLFVKNLDASIDDERLRNIFAEFGTITSAVVMRDDKGVSKGFGFVCYSDSQDATNAQVNLNKRMIENKPLYVSLAQRKEERRQELALAQHQRLQNMRAASMGMYPGMMQPGMMYAAMQQRYPYVAAAARPPAGRYPQPAMGMGMPPQPYMVRGPGAMPKVAGGPAQGQPPAGRGGRGGPQAGQVPRQAGGRNAPNPRGQPAQNQQAQYRAQARNVGQQQMAPQQHDTQAQLIHGQPGQEPLSLHDLARLSDAEQRTALGERLYPLIQRLQGDNAGKITGMLLEMDVPDLVHLLDDQAALRQKVDEAVDILEEHQRADN